MARLLLWQIVMLILAIGVSAMMWGMSAIGATIWGGLCYFLPTVVAIMILKILKKNPVLLPMAFIMAEMTKITLACLMMFIVYLTHQADNWLAFLSGLILVSQAGLFTFFGKRWVL